MALVKLECTCEKCGKTFEHRKKCYNSTEASSYAEWAKEHITICPDCYNAYKAAEEDKKIEDECAALPVLEGSEKQIAWAKKIRHNMLQDNVYAKQVKKIIRAGRADELVEAIEKMKSDPETKVNAIYALRAYKSYTETSAKWFIENR